MYAGGVTKAIWLRRTFYSVSCVLCSSLWSDLWAIAQESGGAADRVQRPAAADRGVRRGPPETIPPQDEYEDIFVNVPNIAYAGRILREVSILKAQEGFPPGDGEPRFDAENNRLYFHTSPQNAAAMKKILAKIEAGDAIPNRAASNAKLEQLLLAKPEGRIYAIEIWLVQFQLPKGQVVELAGPRAEMLTVLGGLEKESKAEVLNHIYLTAEEQKQAQAVLNESVSIVDGQHRSGPSGGGGSDGARPDRGVSVSLSKEMIGTQIKVLPQALGEKAVLLDYTVSKSYLSKPEEGSLIPTDSSGGGYRQPNTRLFEVESKVRVALGEVRTASSQLRGGEKPTEIRVLVLVNPL